MLKHALAPLAFLTVCGFAGSVNAKCSWREPWNCPKAVVEAVGQAAEVVVEAAVVVVTAPVAVAADIVTGQPIGTTTQNILNTTDKAINDVEAEGQRAINNTAAEGQRAIDNTTEAGRALGAFLEAQANGYQDAMSSAEERLREGKIIDAIWHASIAPTQITEAATAEAVQESTILNAVAHAGATAYGGPGGAAAYAAWYTYRVTGGDAEAALKMGMIAGLASAGMSYAADLPSDSASQLVEKTLLAGAVGGTAVAAAGGDQQALLEGFVKAGGMVLIQDGFRTSTGQEMDGRGATGAPYCMATVGAECSPELAFIRDAEGNVVMVDGKPQVDMSRVDPSRSHVGTWAKAGETGLAQETGAPMQVIAQIPGMNTMSVFHDTWSIAWDMDPVTNVATIIPAIVLTYTGLGTPLYSEIEQAGIESQPGSVPAPTSSDATQEVSEPPMQDAAPKIDPANSSDGPLPSPTMQIRASEPPTLPPAARTPAAR